MKPVYKRRLLKSRRMVRRGGAPPWLTALLVLGILGSLAAAAGVGAVFAVYRSYAADYVPITEKLRQTNIGLTEIYDRGGPEQGVKLGALTNPDQQLLDPVHLGDMSPWVIEATISTEDNSFWDNPGVNIKGLARAAYENYVGGGIGSGTGGSSITQQLIKNVYICPSIAADARTVCTAERTLDRKLKEIAYALELEKDYSKDEILEWYLNQISYADRYIGIQAAAQGYFHKNAADLTLAEAAMLAGVPSAPTTYHPRLNCAVGDDGVTCATDDQGRTTVVNQAKQRQEDVLELMVAHKRATRAEVDAAKAEELRVYAATNPLKASAFIDNQVEPRLVRMCEAKILPKLPQAADCEASVHSAGYKVTSTLDWAETDVAQQMIRGFIADGLSKGCECNNAAIVTIEPTTGQVIVYAPNRDPSYTSDPRVAGNIDQLVEINQPGSSFKPAVYLNWFDSQNKAPMSTLWDTSPLTIEGVAITNPRSGASSEGLITAYSALGGSQNVGAFRAAQEGGVDNVIEMAKKLGITTLDQRFDPTFRAHVDVTYGASIATGGANIRVIDMAYMNAVIANMGQMIGVPTLAKYADLKDLKSTAIDTGTNYDLALKQKEAFNRGNLRINGTRALDPVVVLEVRDNQGNILYKHGDDLQKAQVVDAGSVWLLHSIMSDCDARWIIWSCGSSNDDLALNTFVDGTRIPGGVKTGTQQGPKSAIDTLATWTNGYSRYAATSLWVGNADKSLVKDGPAANYAAANTTVKLYKNWMGEYHAYLQRRGVMTTPQSFVSQQPKNVAQRSFASPTTDKGAKGGCDQRVTSWVRTDVTYASECESREIDTRNGLLASDQTPAQFRETKQFVKLPGFKADLAIELARARDIPIAPTERSTGAVAVEIKSISNGRVLGQDTPVVGAVGVAKKWKLEMGAGAAPSEWKLVGEGQGPTDGVLGILSFAGLADGVYTVKLSTGDLSTSVTFNYKKGAPPGSPGPGGSQTPPNGSQTPAPGVTRPPTILPTPTP